MTEEILRPLAHPEKEQETRDYFPWQSMSAEEYAARYSVDCGCFSYDNYTYRDATLHAWIQRLALVMTSRELLNEARKKYLNESELQEVLKREQEEF